MSTPALLSFTLSPRRGFHSTLSAGIALYKAAPGCSSFILYTLPPSIIVDRYELSDRNITFELWGESNLELPVFAVEQSDVTLLLSAMPAAPHLQEVVVDVPIHVRYGPPLSRYAHYQSIEIPPPMCFWACPGSGTLNRFRNSPLLLTPFQWIHRFAPPHHHQLTDQKCYDDLRISLYPKPLPRFQPRNSKCPWAHCTTCLLSRQVQLLWF